MTRISRAFLAVLPALLAFIICLLCSPGKFDAVDGTEFAVTGMNLDVAHPPGYPLFLMLLRSAGLCTGYGYASLILLNCLLYAVLYMALRKVFLSLGTGRAGAAAGPLLFLCLPPVLMQGCILEVHALAMLLVVWAIAARKSPAGPYLFSLAIFGGHPTSLMLLPMGWSRRFRKGLLILIALIPATLWLYVPLRAQAASVAHYTRPGSLSHMLGYLGLYGDRLSLPSPEGPATIISLMGPFVTAALVILAVAGYRSWKRAVPSMAAALVFLSLYRADDLDSMAWLLLLPASLMAATGISALWGKGITGKSAVTVLMAASCVSGIALSDRSGDNAAWLYSRDLLGSTSYRSVYCTVSHDTYYLAYLTEMDDRRPDVLPVDLYGNYFDLTVETPLPSSIAGRQVFCTRAWGEDALELRGLLFGPSGPEPDWESYAIFRFEERIRDRRTRDLVAEAWLRRALQQDNRHYRDSLGRIALEWAATGTTRERIVGLLENCPR